MEDTHTAKEILERMRRATEAKSDSELGRLLGVSQQAIYNARNSNKLPDSWVHKLAKRCAVSADWLYFGDGTIYRKGHFPADGLQIKHISADAAQNSTTHMECAEQAPQQPAGCLPSARTSGDICANCIKLYSKNEQLAERLITAQERERALLLELMALRKENTAARNSLPAPNSAEGQEHRTI